MEVLRKNPMTGREGKVRLRQEFSRLTLVLGGAGGAGQGSEDRQRPRRPPATMIRYRVHPLGRMGVGTLKFD